jgi:hypothetical protein
MFLRDERHAFDQELKEMVHEWLANAAKNISILVHKEGFSPLGC